MKMNHRSFFSWIALLLLLIMVSCKDKPRETDTTTEEAKVQDTPRGVALPAQFYKKLKGTIGDGLKVTMDLTKTDTVFTGSYSYDNVGLPLFISGSLSPMGDVLLRETNKKGEETGRFEGQFSSENVFDGHWINPKNKKALPFSLTAFTANGVEVTYVTHRRKNCANRDRNRKLKAKDYDWHTDTICSSIELTVAKLVNGDPVIVEKINRAIERSFCGTYKTVEGYLHLVDEVEEDGFLEHHASCTVITNDADVLCFSLGGDEYAGGAHGMFWISYVNFDLRTGKQLGLTDLLKPGFKSELSRVAEAIFTKEHGSAEEGWGFEPGNFELKDEFAITRAGLTFSWNPYEIGPYVAGVVEIQIPYAEISAWIPENGILSRIWHQ